MDKSTQSAPPSGSTPHTQMFDLLCHAERAEQAAARVARSGRQQLDEDTEALLKERALSSLKRPADPHAASPQWRCKLKAFLQGHQKKAAASSPIVIAPITRSVAGSVTATET